MVSLPEAVKTFGTSSKHLSRKTSAVQLLSTPQNPLPPGGDVSGLATRDGVSLRAATWDRTAGPDRGTVVLLQGRAEFIEKYFEVVEELRERGFRVVAFDWRGQGGSDRALANRHRGHIRHFADFRLDFEAVRERFLAGPGRGPITVLAHSMGGCVALAGAREGWLDADRLVLSGPMVSLSLVRRPRLVRAFARLLGALGLRGQFVPGGGSRSISTLPFPGNRLCTDPVRYARNAAVATALESGAIGAPTIGWLLAAYEAMDGLAAPGLAAAIDRPVLIVAGEDDPICSTPALMRFARELPHGTLVTVPGARHEILMETDALRARFWDAFDAFMAEETAAFAAGA